MNALGQIGLEHMTVHQSVSLVRTILRLRVPQAVVRHALCVESTSALARRSLRHVLLLVTAAARAHRQRTRSLPHRSIARRRGLYQWQATLLCVSTRIWSTAERVRIHSHASKAGVGQGLLRALPHHTQAIATACTRTLSGAAAVARARRLRGAQTWSAASLDDRARVLETSNAVWRVSSSAELEECRFNFESE